MRCSRNTCRGDGFVVQILCRRNESRLEEKKEGEENQKEGEEMGEEKEKETARKNGRSKDYTTLPATTVC